METGNIKTIKPGKILGMRSKILVLGFLAVALFGCRATFVPPYDASIEAQIIKTARLTDALYLGMLDVKEANRNYDLYAAKYLEVQIDINSLLLKTQIRDHNKDLLVIVQNLKKLFEQFKDDHKKKIILADADIMLNQMQINAIWAPLLMAERALQRQK
jgi:hypothetical protein